MKPINLAEKLAGFAEHWQPRTVGAFNGHDLMVKGRLTVRMREGNVTLGPGEVFAVPKGVEH